MSDIRIWHSSRDAYHCIYRFVRLLVAANRSVELERLRILDVFLLFPPLLHRISMPQNVKAAFRELEVKKPELMFLRLPSPAAVYQELRIYQNSAIALISAQGLIDAKVYRTGLVEPKADSIPSALRAQAIERNGIDENLLAFLLGPLSSVPLRGQDNIYRRVGLPSRVITE